LAGWKPTTRVNLFRGQKVKDQGHLLKIGVIVFPFHSAGTAATDINCLYIIVSGSGKHCFSCLSRSGGNPSGPQDKLLFSPDIAILTLDRVTKGMDILVTAKHVLMLLVICVCASTFGPVAYLMGQVLKNHWPN